MQSHNGRLSIRVRKNLCGLAFVALTALGGGAAQAAEVVCLGASYVQGWGVAPNEAFPAQLEAMLHAKGINVAVANAGVSDDTTAGALARFDSVVDASTRVLVMGIGPLNDRRYGYTPEESKANQDQILAKARARGIKVVDALRLFSKLPDSARQGDNLRHPNAEGDRILAAELLPQVIAALRK
ncbi:MAG: GDSL-type esterase/lipase family protein [Roseiarcus sp.]